MLKEAVDAVAADITAKTGITAIGVSTNQLREGNAYAECPFVNVLGNCSVDLNTPRYTVRTADGAMASMPFDLNNIPLAIVPVPIVCDNTLDGADDNAEKLRGAYATPASIAIPLATAGTAAIASLQLSQLRSMPADGDPYCTADAQAEKAMVVPVAYPEGHLRVSITDHDATLEMLSILMYYRFTLEANVPKIIQGPYAKIAGGTKKRGLFDKVLSASPVGDILGQTIPSSVVSKLAADAQNGTLNRAEFEEAFLKALPVVPDLYDRALRHESAESVLAAANGQLAEAERRADAIADALGIERNPGNDGAYQPRSAAATLAYLECLQSDINATMGDAIEAYREQAANEQATQDQIQSAVIGLATDKLDGMTGGKASLVMNIFQK
ncbi:hypothetical protein [uncultured Adlercreutzia sp.]|uniref:hypothetical protein n=1 Tax=uncultured Adlercreutzia sp. TaxID=875803 RepID=UPI0025E5EE2D|nr:hypothetical protein [uncultured Adlercreutzia sp.]